MSKSWTDTPCYNWPGSCTPSGYARVQINGKYYRVSRILGEKKFGPLKKSDLICHHCDNRRCINPTHFFKGTHQLNRADCVAKRRQARGESHGASKLKLSLARQIRSEYQFRQSGGIVALSKKYHVGTSTIHRVLKNETWNEK